MKGIEITRTSAHCEESWHEFYRSITDQKREAAASVPFATMVQAFVTLACIGRAENKYVTLSKPREIFIAISFDRTIHVPVLVALAYERLVEEGVSQDGAIERASTSKGFVPVVEGWAQGGAEFFKVEVERSGVPAMEWLTRYISRASKKLI